MWPPFSFHPTIFYHTSCWEGGGLEPIALTFHSTAVRCFCCSFTTLRLILPLWTTVYELVRKYVLHASHILPYELFTFLKPRLVLLWVSLNWWTIGKLRQWTSHLTSRMSVVFHCFHQSPQRTWGWRVVILVNACKYRAVSCHDLTAYDGLPNTEK